MTRPLGKAIVTMIVVLTTLVVTNRQASAEGGCDNVRQVTAVDGVGPPTPHTDGKFTPIVLVHGFISSADIWSKPTIYSSNSEQRPSVKRSLLGNLQALPGAVVFTVDYRKTNTRWFTEPGAGGEAFVNVVDCVAAEDRFAGHQVIVVAHSMGGLIARWAVTDAQGAETRRARTGLAVTIGTPYDGAWVAGIGAPLLDALGSVAEGAVTAVNAPLLDLLHLALAACKNDNTRGLEPCNWLTMIVKFLASVHAFAPGSKELGDLSPWPKGMRIETLASSAVVQDLGGLFIVRGPGSVDLGDVVVGRASATSGGHPAKVAECRYTTAKWTTDVNAFLERAGMRLDTDTSKLIGLGLLGACFHIHESILVEHTAAVLGAVAEELQRYDATRVVQVRPVDPRSRLASGFTVTDTVTGATGALDGSSCSPASNQVGKAYRCFGTNNGIYDPCWSDNADPSVPTVLCMSKPWSKDVTRMILAQAAEPALGPPSDPRTDSPWGVQLSTGQRCLAASGSHSTFNGQVVDYSCDGSSMVLLRPMDRSHSRWTFRSAYYQNGYTAGPTVAVTTAWYGLPNQN